MANGVQQVRFAQTDAAIEEQRVVGDAGMIDDGQGRGVGESIRLTDDEVAERVAGIERAWAAHLDCATPRPRGRRRFCLQLDVEWAEERGRPLTALLTGGLRRCVCDEFDSHGRTYDVGDSGMNSGAEFSLEPRDVEGIRSRYTQYAGPRVVRETTGAPQVRIEVSRACIHLQAR
jgi:hypothetical protein